MEGPVHVIATQYCPLETIEEKFKNQQKFCKDCPFHDNCEEKAKTVFQKLKETYLAPYTQVLKVAKETKGMMERIKNTILKLGEGTKKYDKS